MPTSVNSDEAGKPVEYHSVKEEAEIKHVPTSTADELVQKELHYQARLLEKDRILHYKEKQVQSLDRDIRTAKMEMKEMESNNKGMLTVVNEYEKTISEVISDRERERVCGDIEKEKLIQQRDQTLDDLHSAERAFNDVHR